MGLQTVYGKCRSEIRAQKMSLIRYVLAKFHVREYWESDDSRKAGEACFYRKMNSCAHFLCWFVYIPPTNLSLSRVIF